MKTTAIARITSSVYGSLVPALVFAQVDSNSDAYQSGRSVGKMIGYAVLALAVVLILRKFFKK